MKNRIPKAKCSYCISLFVTILILFLWSVPGLSGTNGDEIGWRKRSGPGAKIAQDSEVSKDNIKGTIEKLERYEERSSWKNQKEAIKWARDQFNKHGIESQIDYYESDGKIWPNLCAGIRGIKDPETSIMVIAHIDSISRNPKEASPGADDNGSGVAVLFEAARILRQHSFEKSVQFCIFTNEDQGKKGSKAFARKAKNHGQKIEAVINVDILGFNRPGVSAYWEALWNHGSFRNAGKALYRMTQNMWLSLSAGRDVVVVAGRPANATLVGEVTEKIQEDSGIKARAVVGADCG